jgi:hypothetical protein
MKPAHLLPHFAFFLAGSAFAAEPWFPGPKEVEISFETLSASDIDVRSYDIFASGDRGDWTAEASLGLNTYRETYVPVLFGDTVKLSEETVLASLDITRRFDREWSGTLGLSAYDGFQEYRSIWIAEYYRQLFGNFTGYHAPDPGGYSLRASSSWNDPTGARQASFALFFANDEIAPGWSFDPAVGQPVADDDTLQTYGTTISGEQALSGWLNTQLALNLRKTSGRDARFGIENSWAATRGPVSMRLTGGYSVENPSFDSTYLGAVIEWQFAPEWSANIGLRAYQDSGEVQSSGFNALAPPVDTTEIFGGILWNRGNFAASAGIGLLETDYEPLSEDNEFFGNLYKDRDWVTLKLGFSHRF